MSDRLPLAKLLMNFSGRHLGFKAYRKKLGACHGDDLLYLFPFDPPGFPKGLKTEADKTASKRFVALILNMVYQGNPTPLKTVDLNNDSAEKRSLSEQIIGEVCWNPIGEGRKEYLNISGDELKMEYDENFIERCKFWNENDTTSNIIHSSVEPIIQHLSVEKRYEIDSD